MEQTLWGLPDPDTQPEFYTGVPSKRLVAFFIDSIIIVVLCVLALPFTAFLGLFFFPLMYMVIGFAYRTVMLARNSATLGMLAMSIEVRDGQGRTLDLPMAVMHTGAYSALVISVFFQIGSIVLMLSTPRAQGLHDYVLGTAVINRAA